MHKSNIHDPVELTAALVRCPSVTPEEGGALTLLAERLGAAGFDCRRVDREGVPNLLARRGPAHAQRSFGFNGHTDVVPVGDEAGWTVPPFSGEIVDGHLRGRGAVDMKSGVAAFACAAMEAEIPEGCAVVLAITGDEEGDALHGTVALLDEMERTGERMDVCLVGEPTSPDTFGQAMKIGRRGSLTARIEVRGVQGHSAYPQRALNPVHAMTALCGRLLARRLDEGTEHFEPSNLQVVAIETGNPASNVIPASCRALVNLRFNDTHSGADLTAWMEREAKAVAEETGASVDVSVKVSGEAFLTPPGPLVDLVAGAVEAETGARPELSTGGGTSDARFVAHHCPVVEFGLVGRTMHEVDERVPVEDVHRLKRVYARVLADYFSS